MAIHFNESENEISQINLDDLAALLRSRMNGLQPFESTIEQTTETMFPSHKTNSNNNRLAPNRLFERRRQTNERLVARRQVVSPAWIRI